MILSGYSLNNILNFNRTLVHKILKNRLCEYSLSFIDNSINNIEYIIELTFIVHFLKF